MRIGEDMFDDTRAAVRFRIRETIKKAITLRVIDRVSQVALFLVTERFSVAYEKLKVARVRLIDVRVVNLVHDAVTEREPNATTGMICCAYAFFCARSPVGFDSRCAKCDRILRWIHPMVLFWRLVICWGSSQFPTAASITPTAMMSVKACTMIQ